jgi:signal peptidase II
MSIGERIEINDHFSFVLVHNKGIGFGVFSSHPLFVLILQFIGILSITFFLGSKHTNLQLVIKILILSGAIGNLLNRLILGYVIDFILIKPYPFVFNMADIELRIGLLLIIYLIIKKFVYNFKTEKIKQERFLIK